MEAEEPPEMIGEWYKRATRIDWNWRQMQVEEKFYGWERKEPPKLVVKLPFTLQQSPLQQQQPQQCLVQPAPKPFTPQWGKPNLLVRDPNVIEVDWGQHGPLTCFKCGKKGHITQNCWARVEQVQMMTREEWWRLEDEERQKREKEEADNNLKD